MTNEEAIMILKAMIDEMILVFDRDRKKALNMAIEALKEQPKHDQNTMSKQPDLETFGAKTGETCEDVISRRDAIDVILADKIDAISLKVMTALGDGRLALTLNDACDRHIRDIEKLPSVQPERKRGKWIRITQGAIPEKYICPFCHRTVESYGVEELLSICYPYCHCGADMRGEADED